MDYTLKLAQFEGPLELLLKLIEDEKLDITTISLASVTDQYLAYIENEDVLPPDEVADFLVVAARLIYIKSKYLLPSAVVEDEEGESLEEQLKIYREYYKASKVIEKLLGKRQFAYVRTQPLKIMREIGFSPPPHLTATDLPTIFESIVKRLDAVLALPNVIMARTVSIKEKINLLRDALRNGILHFHRFYEHGNKTDVIVSFLALLEMVKMRHVHAAQGDLFSEITITKGTFYE